MRFLTKLIILASLIFNFPLRSQHLELRDNRVTGVHNGNLIRTRFTNNGILGHRVEKPSMEWPKGKGIEYGQVFVMFAGARITDEAQTQYYIFTESYDDEYNQDEDPTGTYTYSWEPLPGYYNTLLPQGQQTMAMSNIPESWPAHWIWDYPGEEGTRDGMWNGEFKAAPIADQESYYVMVDWNNTEFEYYPFPEDSSKGGLGLEVKVRTYQWADPLAEDILISIYDIQNTSQKIIKNCVFGMYADADVGGPLNDVLSFDPTGDINITYQWDKVDYETGYFGFAFLESPGIDTDGFDNDEDGLYDEARDSGRGTWIENDASPYMMNRYGQAKSHWSGDEDGDWNPDFHDTGSDGLLPGEEEYSGPDTDGTEGNGLPDDGEPNFDRTDLDESDQIGLSSFSAALVNYRKLKDDEVFYERTEPDTYEQMSSWGGARNVSAKQKIDMEGNAEFIYGSGYFPLRPLQTERFSVATVYGHTDADILGNKAIMQRIYDDNYRFAKPPIKPTLWAYAKDKAVILSWDSQAEESYDDIYGYDFEGYILYRATDPEFNEVKTITDNLGNPFYYTPIVQFDLVDSLKGPHPIAAGANISGVLDIDGNVLERIVNYPGLGVHMNMGTDSGLQHYYIDTDVENGRTYYYALVAYDRGYDFDFYQKGWSDRHPRDGFKPIYPVQNSKTITQDVVGNIIYNDRNTAIVTTNAPAAGTELAKLDGEIQYLGPTTSKVEVIISQPDSLKSGHRYRMTFTDTLLNRETSRYQIRDVTENRLILKRKYTPPPIIDSDFRIEVEENVFEKNEAGFFDGTILLMENRTPSGYNARWLSFEGVTDTDPETSVWSGPELYLDDPNGSWHFVGGEFPVPMDVFPVLEKPYPSTFEIKFYSHPVDTTISSLEEFRIPINFKVFDVDEGDQLYVLSEDTLEYPTAYHSKKIVLIKKIRGILFAIQSFFLFEDNRGFDAPFILPTEGSVIHISASQKNFTSRDSVEFSVKAAQNFISNAKMEMEKIAVVPDPYVANASWEKPLYFTSGRGERRVDFIHLPALCTIRIFTLDGKLVRTLAHDSAIEDGHHSWDLTSKDGLDVAPGIYIYHVDAPNVGEKMGRFALIK